jgi:hypothetical protein
MNQQKQYLKVLILTLSSTFSSNNAMLTSLFKPTLKNIVKEQEDPIITKIKAIKQLATVDDVDHEIHRIQDGIYHETLKEIEDVTHKPYNRLQYYFDLQRIIVKDLLQTENPSITQKHSKNIPPSIYNDIIFLLKKNNIDPKNITLKYEITSEENLLASAKGAEFNAQDFPYFKKPQIKLFSELTKEPKPIQMFTYQHELSHILLQHTFMQSVVLSHVDNPENCNIDKLTSLNEKEADIYAASKNLLIAHAGMESRCTYGHPDIIDPINHCDTMLIMYALMKQKDNLIKESL